MDGTDEALHTLPATWRARVLWASSQHCHGLQGEHQRVELVASFKREPDEADVRYPLAPYINAEYKGAQYGLAIREADLG